MANAAIGRCHFGTAAMRRAHRSGCASDGESDQPRRARARQASSRASPKTWPR
jgi:hypothetical protein